MLIIGAFDARHLTVDNKILIILYDLYHIIRMLQDRQFNDPRFLGHYWLVGSTLDLALKIFLFYFVSFSKRNGAQWNNDKSFTDQAEPFSVNGYVAIQESTVVRV